MTSPITHSDHIEFERLYLECHFSLMSIDDTPVNIQSLRRKKHLSVDQTSH